MTNAIIYCRISQDRSGQGLGVDRQESDAHKLADLKDWNVVAVKIDNDLSAAGKAKRPAFDEVLAMIESGKAQVIIAWALDRLTRNRRDQLRLMETCEKAGAVVALVRGGEIDMTTPNGRMMADFLSTIARGEIEVRGDRIRRAREQGAIAGKWNGGIRPFGFKSDGVTIEPPEAAEIVKATEALLAGASLRSVVKAINAAGFTTSRGKEWSTVEMRDMLMRARNAGLAVYKGEVVGLASWPAIVPEASWRALVALLTDPTRRTSPGNRARWLGSGIYLCGGCGEAVICSRSGQARNPCYRCRPPRGETRRPGQHVTRAAAPLDEFVEELVIERLSRPDAVNLLMEDQRDDVAPLHVEAVALRARLDELATLHADGAIDARQLVTGSTRIRSQLEGIESRIAAASQSSIFAGVVGTENPRATWKGLELGRKRAVLGALMTVTILPARHGRGPDGSYFDPDTVKIDPKR